MGHDSYVTLHTATGWNDICSMGHDSYACFNKEIACSDPCMFVDSVMTVNTPALSLVYLGAL